MGRALNLDLRDILPQFPPQGVRALVVWIGETSFQDTERERELFAELAPRLRVVEMEGHNSLPYEERPVRFLSAIRGVLEGCKDDDAADEGRASRGPSLTRGHDRRDPVQDEPQRPALHRPPRLSPAPLASGWFTV